MAGYDRTMFPHYDNYALWPDKDGMVDVERIYCFTWDKFDEGHWTRLEEVFATLPQHKKVANGEYRWYSETDDIESGFLAASIETPGLQVFGTLYIETFIEWDRVFQSLAVGLPTRVM